MTRADLLLSGLSHSAISRRVKRGALFVRYPGVYSYGPGDLSREAGWMAVVLAAGEGAVLSHLTAAALYGVSRWHESSPHVVVPYQRRPIDGIVVHRCRRLDERDVTVRRGIPVTTVARMYIDLGDVLTPHQLAYVINESAFRKLYNHAAALKAIERSNGRWGLAVVKRAIQLYDQGSAGTRSRYEDLFLHLTQMAGFTEPNVNMELLGYEVDFHWPRHRLVVEVDGNHTRPRDHRNDAARDAVLGRAGYAVIRFPAKQVEECPDTVLSRLAPLLPATRARADRALSRSR